MDSFEPQSIDWTALFNEFPRGVGVLNNQGCLLYGNARLNSLFRMDSDILTIRYAPVQGQWLCFLKDFLAGTSRLDKLKVSIPLKNGRRKWFSIRLIRNDRDSHIFLFEDDITQQHLYEVQLQNARVDAEKATKTKSDFLANMSHEIRTPIHTIIGMAELMDTTALDQEQEEYSSQIRFSADVLLSLINDILDFSKIEAGQLELEYTECNLQDLVEDSIDLVAP